MKYKIDHDYHIHSNLSECASKLGLLPECILRCAKATGLSRICLTNHYWDSAVPGASDWYKPQDFEHLSLAKPLPNDPDVEFYFGCEADMDKNFTIGLPKERYDDFEFIIVSTTHLHMNGFTITEEERYSNQARADLWVKRFDALLQKDLPFHKVGVAHLPTVKVDNRSRENYLKTLSLIPSDEMERLFSKAAELGCGIELNQGDMSFAESEADIVLRSMRIAKACGCKFYLGSDAHRASRFATSRDIFERAIDMLDLKESDKFYFK